MKKTKILLAGAVGVILSKIAMEKKNPLIGHRPHDNMTLSEVLEYLRYMERKK